MNANVIGDLLPLLITIGVVIFLATYKRGRLSQSIGVLTAVIVAALLLAILNAVLSSTHESIQNLVQIGCLVAMIVVLLLPGRASEQSMPVRVFGIMLLGLIVATVGHLRALSTATIVNISIYLATLVINWKNSLTRPNFSK